MKRAIQSVLAVVIPMAFLLAACGEDEKKCEDFCGEGAACVGGSCVPVAACDPACGTGEACDNGTCVPTLESACGGTCAAAQVCIAAGGAAECVTVCGPGQVWDPATQTCDLTSTVAHRGYLAGFTFASGPDVTAACLQCHEADAQAMFGSAHFQWAGPIPGVTVSDPAAPTTVGKKDFINNFCIAVPSNENRCTQCHAGYGAAGTPGYAQVGLERVDCLICHADLSLGYTKAVKNWGAAEVNAAAPGLPSGATLGDVLLLSAQSVGKPKRDNCGFCHFNAGGGDNVKMGDLGSSLNNPSVDADVHMGGGMVCVDCHTATNHLIAGTGVSVAVKEAALGCTDCHEVAPHANGTLNGHTAWIACQTCHVPAFARQLPTKMEWNWRSAGDKSRAPVPTDFDGVLRNDYDWMKGDFVWQKNVPPAYRWYDGRSSHQTILGPYSGDPVALAAPTAAAADAAAKIHPFKEMRGTQAAMLDGSFVIVPHLFGPDGFWDPAKIPAVTTEAERLAIWDDVLADGAIAAGQLPAGSTLTYGTDWGWITTRMYMNVNHEVAPKASALGCGDCHGGGALGDLTLLGYPAGCTDPMNCGIRP